jgi:hypothetical protein
MLKKPDHPIALAILRSSFFAGFGFAIGEAVQRVNDACSVDAVCQGKNILELAGEYFDPRVTLFTVVLLIVAAAEASFFFYQSRLKRQVMRAAEKAAATDRQLETETRALLVCLRQYDLEHELATSLNDAA